jgi:hypothetical protein
MARATGRSLPPFGVMSRGLWPRYLRGFSGSSYADLSPPYLFGNDDEPLSLAEVESRAAHQLWCSAFS